MNHEKNDVTIKGKHSDTTWLEEWVRNFNSVSDDLLDMVTLPVGYEDPNFNGNISQLIFMFNLVNR